MGPVRNRLTKHYLGRWGRLEQNAGDLSSVEMIQLKILYAALKELSPQERQFLAEKYRVPMKPKRPYLRDDELAEPQGMTEAEYKAKRIAIESKLNPLIEKYREQNSDELVRAIRAYGR